MSGRATWPEAWMGVAEQVARRSRCDGAQVGCVLVDAGQRPVSTGYNGPPRGFDDSAGPTCSSWCTRQMARSDLREAGVSYSLDPAARDALRLAGVPYGLGCPSVHAEANALLFADRRDYEGGTAYVTAAVCADCAKLLAQSGVSEVVMRVRPEDAHRDPDASVSFLRSCGVGVTVLA